MFDIAILETGNGGDGLIQGNDFVMVFGIENMPYLAMFGGNPGFISKNKVTAEQSFDYWGNNLLMPNNQDIQFNSLLEQKLKTVALNSSGRIQIEDAIRKDLLFLSSVATVTVKAVIESTDRIRIEIRIVQNNGITKVKIVNFRKVADGDFVFLDFNDDFNV